MIAQLARPPSMPFAGCPGPAGHPCQVLNGGAEPHLRDAGHQVYDLSGVGRRRTLYRLEAGNAVPGENKRIMTTIAISRSSRCRNWPVPLPGWPLRAFFDRQGLGSGQASQPVQRQIFMVSAHDSVGPLQRTPRTTQPPHGSTLWMVTATYRLDEHPSDVLSHSRGG